ncbi:unnamed protein product, partial [Trichogramma brassicae]
MVHSSSTKADIFIFSRQLSEKVKNLNTAIKQSNKKLSGLYASIYLFTTKQNLYSSRARASSCVDIEVSHGHIILSIIIVCLSYAREHIGVHRVIECSKFLIISSKLIDFNNSDSILNNAKAESLVSDICQFDLRVALCLESRDTRSPRIRKQDRPRRTLQLQISRSGEQQKYPEVKRFTTCGSDFLGMRHLAAQTPMHTEWNFIRKSFTRPTEPVTSRVNKSSRRYDDDDDDDRYKSAYYLYPRNYTLPLARATFAGCASWRSVSNFKVEYNQVRVFFHEYVDSCKEDELDPHAFRWARYNSEIFIHSSYFQKWHRHYDKDLNV